MSIGSTATTVTNGITNSALCRNINNTPVRNILLPALLIGNMSYKVGTERDAQKQSDVFWNSLFSWIAGALLVNLNNGVLPYFVLPITAGSIALFKIAQKDTPEEKTDTALNHATWWLSGIGAQLVAKGLKLNSSFQTLCAFAVGTSIVGPLLSHFVKENVLPLFIKDKNATIGKTFEQVNANYPLGKNVDPHFSPFSAFTPKASANLPQSKFNPQDPYNLKQLIPGWQSK